MSEACPVSVVIPCFRSAETLARAVDSVLAQTRPPRELILVDDASPDGGATLARLRALAARPALPVPVRVVERPLNGGAGSARNSGWEVATAPLVAFLDSDEAWHPRKLELQSGWMAEHPEVALSGHLVRTSAGGVRPDWSLPARLDATHLSYRRLLLWNVIPTSSVMLRRSVAARFQEGKRYSEDFLLWLELLAGGARAALLQAPLGERYKRPFGEGGLTGQLWALERGELETYAILRQRRELSAPVYYPLVALSLIKYARRCAITALHEAKR